jgi:hypothetical protein
VVNKFLKTRCGSQAHILRLWIFYESNQKVNETLPAAPAANAKGLAKHEKRRAAVQRASSQ